MVVGGLKKNGTTRDRGPPRYFQIAVISFNKQSRQKRNESSCLLHHGGHTAKKHARTLTHTGVGSLN